MGKHKGLGHPACQVAEWLLLFAGVVSDAGTHINYRVPDLVGKSVDALRPLVKDAEVEVFAISPRHTSNISVQFTFPQLLVFVSYLLLYSAEVESQAVWCNFKGLH